MKTTNSLKLLFIIKQIGFSISDIAEALNLKEKDFLEKVENEEDFKASEIVKLSAILKLSKRQIEDIFFN